MNRRYSSINGGGPTPSQQAANGAGRYSLAGRPSVGPSRISRGNGTNGIAGEMAGMHLGSQPTQSSQRQSLDRNSMSRRSSMYGKQSLTGNQPSIGKDPRPVRDKTFQIGCTKNLLEFLIRVGYPHPISEKILAAPSSKDFQQIFKFLYGHLDPTFEFGKKFEEEVPGLLRGLRYPFANEISKSQLYAVGSMHAWPSLLAMLYWMVELIQCCDELNRQSTSDMMDVDGPSQQVNSAAEKIFFEYLCKTYKVFLAGSDNFESMVSELGGDFDRRNESVLSEAADLSKTVENLEIELNQMSKEEAPLAKAQREKGIYLSDIEKFKKFISHLHVKKQKFFESIDRLEEDINTIDQELGESELQRANLQAQVDAQDICPEDIDRMNADKEQLLRTLESLASAKDEASRVFWDRELQVQKHLDTVEKAVQEYTFVCERIGLLPAQAETFELSFNPHAARPDALLNIDMANVLARLGNLREEHNANIHAAQDKLLGLQESLDRLTETLTDKQDSVIHSEDKLQRMVQSYLADKESYQNENRQIGKESDELEQTIQKLRSDNSASLLHSQQRLQRVTIDYDQLVSRIAEEKERIGNDIFRILEELINFKTNVETTIADLDAAYAREAPRN